MKLHCFDILAISESNLTLKDRNATIAAEDYYIERFDRTNDGRGRGGPGGGVLCYIQKGVNYDKSSVTKSEGANNTQLLAIHLTSPVDLDLVIIYNPPKSRHEKQLEMLMTSLLWRRDPSRHILIIGDVNVNFFEPQKPEHICTLILIPCRHLTKKTYVRIWLEFFCLMHQTSPSQMTHLSHGLYRRTRTKRRTLAGNKQLNFELARTVAVSNWPNIIHATGVQILRLYMYQVKKVGRIEN